MTKFATLNADGSLSNVRHINKSDIIQCPHIIMTPDHYREDGSCKCNDSNHIEMAEWGYQFDGEMWQCPEDFTPKELEEHTEHLGTGWDEDGITSKPAHAMLRLLFDINYALTGHVPSWRQSIWRFWREHTLNIMNGHQVVVYLNDGGYSRVVVNPEKNYDHITLTDGSTEKAKRVWTNLGNDFNYRFEEIQESRE